MVHRNCSIDDADILIVPVNKIGNHVFFPVLKNAFGSCLLTPLLANRLRLHTQKESVTYLKDEPITFIHLPESYYREELISASVDEIVDICQNHLIKRILEVNNGKYCAFIPSFCCTDLYARYDREGAHVCVLEDINTGDEHPDQILVLNPFLLTICKGIDGREYLQPRMLTQEYFVCLD